MEQFISSTIQSSFFFRQKKQTLFSRLLQVLSFLTAINTRSDKHANVRLCARLEEENKKSKLVSKKVVLFSVGVRQQCS